MESVKPSSLQRQLESGDFKITDSSYGRTAALDRCVACDFRQATELSHILPFYQCLEDPEYERTRAARALQSRKLLNRLSNYGKTGSLLDIGAGSGILVEEALRLGYSAEGVEPSRWLCAKSAERGLPVYQGVLPHPDAHGPYDAVTIVDVIEHVSDPLGLLNAAKLVLRPGGIGVLVTPDVGSLMARLMGNRWWHYRVAHIGYFNRHSLGQALKRSGLEPMAWEHASWYFPADYLATRVLSYFPAFLRPPIPTILQRFTIPLNLFDSFLVVFRNPPRC